MWHIIYKFYDYTKLISQNYDDFAKNDTFLKLTMCYYAFLIFDEKSYCGPVNTIKLMWTIYLFFDAL